MRILGKNITPRTVWDFARYRSPKPIRKLFSSTKPTLSRAYLIEQEAISKRRVKSLIGNIDTIDKRTQVMNKQLDKIRDFSADFENEASEMQMHGQAFKRMGVKAENICKNIALRADVISKQIDGIERQTTTIRRIATPSLLNASGQLKAGQVGDNLSETTGWPVTDAPPSKFAIGGRSRIKVLYLNSMGGSMGRLSKALARYHDMEADCFIGAYAPRRHMVYPHETNVHGIFTHQEWREFMAWAIGHYDIIQSTTLPLWPGVAEMYDWLTDTLGRRHIWRSTGFVHHYLQRNDILPVEYYQRDLKTENIPSPERFPCTTFKHTDTHYLTDPHIVFYSSPEKGAYLKGKDTHWLPSMRDEEDYRPLDGWNPMGKEKVLIYVPYHKSAVWKGLDKVMDALNAVKAGGAPIEVITPENAGEYFPDLTTFEAEANKAASYPVPNHLMPELFRRIDLVIDQIVMGCYGNTGIEAMLCGKPVIGQKRYKDVASSPIIPVEPDTIIQTVENILDRRDEWVEIGEISREYALSKHSPKAVSTIAANVYKQVMDQQK